MQTVARYTQASSPHQHKEFGKNRGEQRNREAPVARASLVLRRQHYLRLAVSTLVFVSRLRFSSHINEVRRDCWQSYSPFNSLFNPALADFTFVLITLNHSPTRVIQSTKTSQLRQKNSQLEMRRIETYLLRPR